MPRAYSTIDTSVYDAGDRLSLRNVIARASLTRKRRREDDEEPAALRRWQHAHLRAR